MTALPAQAHSHYEALFDWQPPLSLWEKSEALKTLLGEERLAARDFGAMDMKRVLEGWVIGKSLAVTYHRLPCLVRVSHAAAMDGQCYIDRQVKSVEVTQALYPGRRRNLFGRAVLAPLAPLAAHEQAAFALYRNRFVDQAWAQIEARIEHKFQLYPSLDYLLVYVDLFDMFEPRFSYFAQAELYEEHWADIEAKLESRFAARWSRKIGHLQLLDDRTSGYITPVPLAAYAQLSLA